MHDIRQSLIDYIEGVIIPQYKYFDRAHQENHVRKVIEESIALSQFHDVNYEIIYTAAAFHDLGLSKGREFHHLESSKIIRNNRNLKKWFSNNEIEIIAQAAEDHRASANKEPRTIYGKIIAEADRCIEPIHTIQRTIEYGISHYPKLDKEIHYDRMRTHLNEKYGRNGYIKLWIVESKNGKNLENLRLIIEDKIQLKEIFNSIFDKIYTSNSNPS